MYRKFDTSYASPPRQYRNPREIREDIREIKLKIKETGEMLNIRSLLLDVLVSERADSPENLIPELECAISEAKEALCELQELEDELLLPSWEPLPQYDSSTWYDHRNISTYNY